MKNEPVIAYDNFFTDEEIDFISLKSLEVLQNPYTTYRTNYTSWDNHIVKDSAAVLIHTVTDDNVIDMVARVSEEKFGKTNFAEVMFYYWSNQSYIPWHDDGHVSNACTVYLNKEWDFEDGGLYQYKQDDEIKVIKPEYNLCLYQNDHSLHATTPTRVGAPWRRSLQFFFKYD